MNQLSFTICIVVASPCAYVCLLNLHSKAMASIYKVRAESKARHAFAPIALSPSLSIYIAIALVLYFNPNILFLWLTIIHFHSFVRLYSFNSTCCIRKSSSFSRHIHLSFSPPTKVLYFDSITTLCI